MLAILFAHAVATALAPLLVYRWGRMAFYPLALVPLGSLIVGALATWLELRWTFVLGGAISVVFALWIALTQREVREA